MTTTKSMHQPRLLVATGWSEARSASFSLLAATSVAMAVACGEAPGAFDDFEQPQTDQQSASPSARLVDRGYPYRTEDDALVCAEWEVDGYGTYYESYRVDVMNRHLANAGTAEGVAHVDEAFVSTLSTQGIDRVESCDSARAYVRLVNSRLSTDLRPTTELGPSEAFDAPSEDVASPESDDDDDEIVPKIINGEAFDHGPTVGLIAFGDGPCSGIVLGPKVILTAAHCVEGAISGGNVWLRAWIQREGSSRRYIDDGDWTKVDAVMDPSWDGESPAFDQALLFHDWHFPVSLQPERRYTRITHNWGWPAVAGNTLAPVKIAGYGVKNDDGDGGGLGRRGKGDHKIAGMTEQVLLVQREKSSASAPCGGDSGSSVYNTTLLNNSSNLALGVASKTFSFTEGKCTTPLTLVPPEAQPFVAAYYSIPDGPWIKSTAAAHGITCSLLQQSSVPYLKCWQGPSL